MNNIMTKEMELILNVTKIKIISIMMIAVIAMLSLAGCGSDEGHRKSGKKDEYRPITYRSDGLHLHFGGSGIFGGSALLMQSPWLLALVTWGGVAFLLWYGFGAFKTAMSSNIELASAEVMKQGRWKIIATMLAVTWLNPHVYLDTFVVLGSLGGQLDVEPKRWFALGTISASFLWFFGLALLAAWLAPRLRTAKAQRIINLVVGCVMWFIALQLARDGIAHAQALFS